METIKLEVCQQDQTKCAEIFRNSDGQFTYVCFDCGNLYKSSVEIVQHIESTHFFVDPRSSPDTQFPLENQFNYVGCDRGDINSDNDLLVELVKNEECGSIETLNTETESHLECPLNIEILYSNEKPYQCDLCLKRFQKLANLKKHIARHAFNLAAELRPSIHDNSIEDFEIFKCNDCEYIFKQKHSLEIHQKYNAAALEAGKPDCIERRNMAKLRKLEMNRKKTMQCTVCGRMLRRQSEVQMHIAAHANLRTQKCEVCGLGFNTERSLKLHKKIHDNERKPFKCAVCGLECRLKSNYVRHIIIHQRVGDEKEKPYKCELCRNRYYHKNSLIVHMRGHTGEKPYQCDLCGDRFINFSKYTFHKKKRHTTEKLFKCDQCPREFHFQYQLREHLRLHSDDRPYQCKNCDKTFKTTKTLRQHALLHSSVKKYKCNYCDMTFSQKAGLRGHERHRHRMI